MTGRNKFAQAIQEQFGKTEVEAQYIIDVFLKLKVAKYNGTGQLQIIHGSFFELDVMDRALEQEL